MDLQEDFKEKMTNTLKETNLIHGDKVKFRNVYYYNMEKIKNSHLNGKENQNKVNDMFSLKSMLNDTVDINILTNNLKDMIKNQELGK